MSQKREPKIMSDGNIARVNMIVVTTDTDEIIIGKIKLTNDPFNLERIILETPLGWEEPRFGSSRYWGAELLEMRKATTEEKKQYWQNKKMFINQ